MRTKFKNEQGQSIIEVVLALFIIGLMIGALTIATIISLRNAQFSQNQVQAAKYAQDIIEKTRAARDKNGTVGTFPPAQGSDPDVLNFSDLFEVEMADYCAGGKCYFTIDPVSFALTYKANVGVATETVGDNYKRVMYMEDALAGSLRQKKITVRVTWEDTGGTHESLLQTVLARP